VSSTSTATTGASKRDRRPGSDHPRTPRGVGPGGRLPDQAFR
jgi:hypothetical protein